MKILDSCVKRINEIRMNFMKKLLRMTIEMLLQKRLMLMTDELRRLADESKDKDVNSLKEQMEKFANDVAESDHVGEIYFANSI